MSIRRRLLFTYLVLVILFVFYSAVTYYLGLLRSQIDLHITGIYKVKTALDEVFISMNNILINWDDGKSYTDFQTHTAAFIVEFEALDRKIVGYPVYGGELNEYLKSLKSIWEVAGKCIGEIRFVIADRDFEAAVERLYGRADFQRLNQLLAELQKAGSGEDVIRANAVAEVIDAIQFFPIYKVTLDRLFNILVAKITVMRSIGSYLHYISIGFFIVVFTIFIFLAARFTKSIVEMFYDVKTLPKTASGYLNESITIYPSDGHRPCKYMKCHRHLYPSFELHHVLKGEVVCLLQKSGEEDKRRIVEVHCFKAAQGQWFILPPGYAHTLFNPAAASLEIVNFVAQESLHGNGTKLTWEEPCGILTRLKDGDIFRPNNNFQMTTVIAKPDETLPLDFLKRYLQTNNPSISLCTQLYDWIKQSGCGDTLQGIIAELKNYIHFQYFLICGTPGEARVLVITREGIVSEPDTVYDFTCDYMEIFAQIRQWLDPGIPVRLCSALDESVLIPKFNDFFSSVGRSNEWKDMDCRHTDSRVYKALVFMVAHYNENFKVGALAAEVCYSVSRCIEWFRKETGKSIIDFRLDLQIEKAKYDLIHTHKRLADIAAEHGFYDQPVFNKKIKQKTGFTPNEYRKKYGL